MRAAELFTSRTPLLTGCTTLYRLYCLWESKKCVQSSGSPLNSLAAAAHMKAVHAAVHKPSWTLLDRAHGL